MKRFSSWQPKISTEGSSLKSYSVVLTSLWPKWLTCLILEDTGPFLCIMFLAQFVPTIRYSSPMPCNPKNQCHRSFFQRYLSGTPSHTSPWHLMTNQTFRKRPKPTIIEQYRKESKGQAIPLSYKSDPRATWCPSQHCPGHRCIS